MNSFVPTKLCVATDAQVVLSWLLSQSMASKNIFAKNRLKDVLRMNRELESQYGLKPLFKYVAHDTKFSRYDNKRINIEEVSL